MHGVMELWSFQVWPMQGLYNRCVEAALQCVVWQANQLHGACTFVGGRSHAASLRMIVLLR